MATKVTDNFSVEEFTCKDGALYPLVWIPTRLVWLCTAMETIRSVYNKPVRVLSGYRTTEYNTKIGGAKFSQHVQGRAADIDIDSVSAEELHQTILDLYHEGRIKIGGLGKYPTFTHIDVRQTNTGQLAHWSGSRTKNIV